MKLSFRRWACLYQGVSLPGRAVSSSTGCPMVMVGVNDGDDEAVREAELECGVTVSKAREKEKRLSVQIDCQLPSYRNSAEPVRILEQCRITRSSGGEEDAGIYRIQPPEAPFGVWYPLRPSLRRRKRGGGAMDSIWPGDREMGPSGEETLSNVGGEGDSTPPWRRTQERSWGPTCWSGHLKRPMLTGAQGAEN